MKDEQPSSRSNNHTPVADLVLSDIRERDELGRNRYGTRLQPLNGRSALRDAYEEAMDLVFYLRQLIEEDAIRQREMDAHLPYCNARMPYGNCDQGCSIYDPLFAAPIADAPEAG